MNPWCCVAILLTLLATWLPAQTPATNGFVYYDGSQLLQDKTVNSPSGDIHDYLSYAPYRWPDDSKKNGLPWKAFDGVVNPVSRGTDTD